MNKIQLKRNIDPAFKRLIELCSVMKPNRKEIEAFIDSNISTRNVNNRNKDGFSFAFDLCKLEVPYVIDKLLDKGLDAGVRDEEEQSLLINIIVYCKDKSLAEKAIKGGARIDDLDKDGSTALMFAIGLHLTDVAQMLLVKGAEKELRNKNRQTALSIARENKKKNKKIIKMLKA